MAALERKKAYGKLEEKIIAIIKKEGKLTYKGKTYKVLEVDKPKSQNASGEPKTDVYILGECNGVKEEFKISVKSEETNEFQENKISAERAEGIFGVDYEDIIERTARSIVDKFNEQALVYASGKHPVQPNSITMGWKLELASKPRKLSAPLQLEDKEIRDYIYKGTNLPVEKKDAVVNGKVIENSGVAEYLLYAELDDINSVEDITKRMVLIDEAELEPMHLIFTANNFRTDKEVKTTSGKSTDGKRPLAVRVDWEYENGKLKHQFRYDKACSLTGYDVKLKTLKELEKLKKSHPSEMSKDDFHNPDVYLK